ncbi:hypothetical protein [Amycolatopsis methanolica]|uniref:Uncharacterized protein n=1 Tax=Amycolatopsis methanolica 239 TaxID=1068978 RepID=A0A076MZ30_AMYME|nr:hypothetical protein [Amycolatopsis methanolica]AIJ25908.1 hypothetical protein AMETH_5816 [Amycolatopsis methanolica 239]
MSRLLLVLLVLDAALLAVLELFFLPLYVGGTIPFPVMVLVAALTTPLLVRLAGRLVARRAAFAPLVAWVLVIVIVGLFGPGGDLVLLRDWRALLLIAGGALPAAMSLGGALAEPPKKGAASRG